MSTFKKLVCRGDAAKIKEYLEDPTNEIEDRQIFINERDISGKNALDFAAMLGREDAGCYQSFDRMWSRPKFLYEKRYVVLCDLRLKLNSQNIYLGEWF